MIRERVSTNGVIRPLEPEAELPAFQLPEELVGEVNELVVRRYFAGREEFEGRFAKVYKSVAKERRRNLQRHAHDAMHHISQLHNALSSGEPEKGRKRRVATPKGIQEGLISTGSWPWAWVLDVDEAPPPSSIVARRDTEEARRLMQIADQAFLMDEHTMSGNHLWNVIVEFLTKSPDKHEPKSEGSEAIDEAKEREARPSRFTRFLTQRRGRSKSAEEAP